MKRTVIYYLNRNEILNGEKNNGIETKVIWNLLNSTELTHVENLFCATESKYLEMFHFI